MEGQLSVPFHFAAEFLILAVCVGACLDALRRTGAGGSVRAASHALGFAILAAAQVVHGARIPGAVEDGATISVVMRVAGFALIAFGGVWAGTTRRKHDAISVHSMIPVALAPGLFVAGRGSQWALGAGVAAAVAAVRGGVAHRRDLDPASFAFAVAFAAFAGGEIALALSPPIGGMWLAVSHVLRLVAALVLARWLAPAIGSSVRLRFVTAFVLALTVLVLVLSAAFNAVITRNLEREELRRVEVTARAAGQTIVTQTQADHQTVRNLAGAGQTLPARPTLNALACFFGDFDLFESVDQSGRVVASSLRPPRACNTSNVSDYVQRSPFPEVPQVRRLGVAGSDTVATALRGRSNASLEIVEPGLLAIVAAAPVGGAGRQAGALAFGRIVDQRMLSRIAGGESQFSLLLGGTVAATTNDNARELNRAFSGEAVASQLRRHVEEERRSLRSGIDVGGERSYCAFVPLRRAAGDVVGVLASCNTQAGVVASQEALNRILFLIALAAAAVAAAIAWGAGGRVSKPIRRLTLAAEAVRRGDLSARAEYSSPDELGALGRAFNQMAESLDRSTADLRAAADTEADLRGRMEAIMQSMDDGLVATDEDGLIVTANVAAERLMGVPVNDMTGAHLSEVLNGSDAAGRNLVEIALSSGATAATLQPRTGEPVPVAITSTPLRDASGLEAGRVVVMRDISTEVQAERMKSEFLSNVSHELRTPLTPIKGYTEILKRKKFPKAKTESFLDGILESTTRLERIVEILVDFAALEAGRLKPRTEPVDLRPFVSRLVGRWKNRSNGRFTVRISSDVPAVNADPRLLTKVLDELIDNAVKFSPEGPRVEILAEPVLNGSRTKKPAAVRLEVKDHGIGIPAEKLPALFRDFQQLDGSETREYGGLGLGLAYVKRVAAAHGGDVEAESKPGRGSTFTLTLPVVGKAERRQKPKTKARGK